MICLFAGSGNLSGIDHDFGATTVSGVWDWTRTSYTDTLSRGHRRSPHVIFSEAVYLDHDGNAAGRITTFFPPSQSDFVIGSETSWIGRNPYGDTPTLAVLHHEHPGT